MKAETAAVTLAATASGITILGGAVLGLPKAAIAGAVIGTLFAIAALPPVPDWRRWIAIAGSFCAGSVLAPLFVPIVSRSLPDGNTVAVEYMHAGSGTVLAFAGQAILSWWVRKLTGESHGD